MDATRSSSPRPRPGVPASPEVTAALDDAHALLQTGYLPEGSRLMRQAATLRREAGDYRGAVEILCLLKAYTPHDLGLLMTLGNLYNRLDEDYHAERHYRTVLSLERDHQEAMLSLARLCQRKGRRRHAVQAYQAYLRHNPDDALAIEEMGGLLQELGALAEAVHYFCSAARSHAGHQDEESARRLYTRALALCPGHQDARQALQPRSDRQALSLAS